MFALLLWTKAIGQPQYSGDIGAQATDDEVSLVAGTVLPSPITLPSAASFRSKHSMLESRREKGA
ncbi:hypothetical protein GWE18_33100 [Bradyrhizobium sp. CSA112]|uniref:hypothetical protein n=1 Tax=Bradyrhizobium sp. CSA112 TaxID=2699170 RepID=UPI0023B04297|nr:hypothetical protein [Bradyrhizobium sp. CSA112]MDE5457571.1 hypothetical protein [Bradyrhizobium sp. CSA112]